MVEVVVVVVGEAVASSYYLSSAEYGTGIDTADANDCTALTLEFACRPLAAAAEAAAP